MLALAKTPIHVSPWMPAWPWKKNKTVKKKNGSNYCVIFYIFYVTDQTVNFWVNPPSKPGTQDTFAWFTSVVTNTEDTAWGLVPEEENVTLNCWQYTWIQWMQESHIYCRDAVDHSPSTMTTVPALTVATRLVARHSQPPWWSLLTGCSRREPLANTVYGERGVGPICEGGHRLVKIRN